MDRTLEKGASIIEILIAIMIVTVSVLGIASFSRNTSRTYRSSRGTDAAYVAGQMLVTDLSARAIVPESGTDTVTVDNISCIRSWTVKDTSFFKRVVVNVSYDLMGVSKQVKVSGVTN
ncbi:MAG TPA: hypothetical protein VKY57_05215 [Chitinispirillaceae bacterium]|nr:hypothetical protein [Chitinispirillaceae bacterium]